MLLALEATTETFEDVEKLLYYHCHNYIKAYGGIFEEIESEAFELFMLAYMRYDASKGSFATFFSTTLTLGLKEFARKASFDKSLGKTFAEDSGAELIESHYNLNAFDPVQFCKDLSSDAQQVVKLLIDTSAILQAVIKLDRIFTKDYGEFLTETEVLKNVVLQFLADMDWTTCRVSTAWSEVQRMFRSLNDKPEKAETVAECSTYSIKIAANFRNPVNLKTYLQSLSAEKQLRVQVLANKQLASIVGMHMRTVCRVERRFIEAAYLIKWYSRFALAT